MKTKKISMKDLKAIGEDLGKRQPPKLAEDIEQDMSLKQVITTLAPDLLRMKRQGFTTDGMVAALKENKVSIDGRTLNRYLNESKASRKKSQTVEIPKSSRRLKPTEGKDNLTPDKKAVLEQPDTVKSNKPAHTAGERPEHLEGLI